jgi:hypothetical protein
MSGFGYGWTTDKQGKKKRDSTPSNLYFRQIIINKQTQFRPRTTIASAFDPGGNRLWHHFKGGVVPQTFNKGNIYEGVDVSTSEAELHNLQHIFSVVRNYLFGKYLAHDQIIASQGGDNPFSNTSIKSGQASLYSYSTIGKQLSLIRDLIDSNIFKSTEQIASDIKFLFLNKGKFNNNDEFNEVANDALDRLLEVLNIKE